MQDGAPMETAASEPTDPTQPPATKRPRWFFPVIVAIVVVIAMIAVAFAYVLVLRPAAPFVAELVRTGRGTYVENNLTIPYVNLSLNFSSPYSIDPTDLIVTVVCAPACYSPLARNGSMMEPAIELRYSANSYPHWVATSNGSIWTGFTMTVTNRDGKVVGGKDPWLADGAATITPGAILMLTLPIPGYEPEPVQSVLLNCLGHPGSVQAALY